MAKADSRQTESPEAAMAMQGLQRKTNYLENSFVEEEEDLSLREVRLEKSESSTGKSLEELRKDIASIKAAVAGISAAFENLANELRSTAKKEEVARLGMRLEKMGVENLVTKKRVKKEFGQLNSSNP